MQARHRFTILAELIERDVLPLLNLMVLLLPLVLLGGELVARSAIAVTLPDPSPDVASLDTPPVSRPNAFLGVDDHTPEPSIAAKPETESEPESESESPATGPSVFSDSPLGYGD
jgi:hypothetical protein